MFLEKHGIMKVQYLCSTDRDLFEFFVFIGPKIHLMSKIWRRSWY